MDPVPLPQESFPEPPAYVEPIPSPKRSVLFPILFVVTIIALLGVTGLAGMLYVQNVQLKNELEESTAKLAVREAIIPTPFPTLTQTTPEQTPTPTEKKVEVPTGWIEHIFNTKKLTLYTPADWDSSMEDFPTKTTLLRFWKKATPNLIPIQLEIKPSWDNTGDAKDLGKNFLVSGTIEAAKVDPPKKEEQVLERYQTNVYFEHDDKVYVFQCVHNWAPDFVDTCNKMMETLTFEPQKNL